MAKAATPKVNTPSKVKATIPVSFRWYYVIVFAFSFLLYANSIGNDYNLDDEIVTINHRLTSKGISAIGEIFTSPYYQDESGYSYEYRPIVLTTFAIEHSMFGDNPQVSHFINTLLYALLCTLLLKVLSDLFAGYSFWFSFIAVMLFAAHPMHTEVVSSIKNRDELLALAFALGALFFSIKFARNYKPQWLVIALILFSLALLSKSTVVSFIALIPIALIVFTEIKIRYALMVAVVLGLPVFFTGKFPYLSTVVIIITAIVVFVLAFALVYRRVNLNVLFNQLGAFKKQTQEEEHAKEGHVNFALVTVAGLVIALCMLFVWLNLFWVLFILTALILTAMPFTSGNAYNLLKIPALALLTSLFVVTKCYESTLSAYIIIAAIMLYKDNLHYKNIPFLFSILSTSIITTYLVKDVALLPLAFILTLLLYLHKKKLALLFTGINFFAAFIDFILTKSQVPANNPYLFFEPILNFSVWGMAALIIVASNYKKVFISVLGAALLFLTFTYINFVTYGKIKEFKTEQITVNKIIQAEAPKPISTNLNRPLGYIEIPFDKNTPLQVRLGTSMEVLGHYLKMLLVPYPMGFYYGYAYIEPASLFSLISILSIAAHTILLCVALWLLYRHPIISFSIIWYLVSISIFSGLIQPVPGMIGDRYLFIPSLGLALIISYLLFQFSGIALTSKQVVFGSFKPALRYSVLALLIVYSGISFARNLQWKDRLTLFNADINHVDKSAQAHNLLAIFTVAEAEKIPGTPQGGQLMLTAISHFKKAVEIYPAFFNAAYDLGRCYTMTGQYDSALVAFNYAIKIDSTFTNSHLYIAEILKSKGRNAEAINYYEQVITIDSNRIEVFDSLALYYFLQKDFNRSIDIGKRALRSNPDAYDPYVFIGRSYVNLNQMDSAITWFEKAYILQPNDLNLVNTLYSLYYQQRNTVKSDFYLQRFNQLQNKPAK